MLQKLSDLYPDGLETACYFYTLSGKLEESRVKHYYQHADLRQIYRRKDSFDHQDRLLHIKQMIDGDPKLVWSKLVSYEYDDFGRVGKKTLHQKYEPIKYTYNVRGQLLSAKTTNSNNLSYTLSYEKDIKGKTTNNFRRISSVKYNHSGSSVPHGYQYTYDTQGRLTSGLFYDVTAKALTDKYAEKDITYDANGNMTHLLRTDEEGNTLHDMNFRYNDGNNGNALSSLRVGNTEHSNYEYDANGNMTRDGYRGLEITYNYLNLPSKVGNIFYIYTAGGRKIAMRDSISRYASTYRYYKGEIEHDGGNIFTLHHPEGFCRFEQARNSTGRWIITSCIYHYMLRDHLGSTRVFTERNGKEGTLDTVQSTSYYPFGLAHEYSNTDKNRHLFSGKELQDGIKSGVALGLYDFGARMYDAVVPRWNGIDPMDQYASPYVYCGNDPVNFVDPTGMYSTSDQKEIDFLWKAILDFISQGNTITFDLISSLIDEYLVRLADGTIQLSDVLVLASPKNHDFSWAVSVESLLRLNAEMAVASRDASMWNQTSRFALMREGEIGMSKDFSFVDDKNARYFINPNAAYNYMWNNSVKSGVPVREVSGWDLKNGHVIVLPYDRNTVNTSHNDALPLTLTNGIITDVTYQGSTFGIKTHVHTHPTIVARGIGMSGKPGSNPKERGDFGMYEILGGKRMHVIYNRSHYSAWHNGSAWQWRKY